jgi:hypothetical protein
LNDIEQIFYKFLWNGKKDKIKRSIIINEYEEGVWSDKGHQFVKNAGSGSYGFVKLYRDNATNVEFVKKQVGDEI